MNISVGTPYRELDTEDRKLAKITSIIQQLRHAIRGLTCI
jgi:hypothetical protein